MGHEILSVVADWMSLMLQSHGSFVVYLSVFLLGENGALAAFMLAAQGYLSPQTVFLYAVFGSLSADIFWYWISVKLLRGLHEKKFLTQKNDQQKMFLLRVAENHTFLFFTFIKFLVGMRLILTIYILLKKRIPFAQYLFMNMLGTFLFIGALFPMGWFLGKGISSAFSFEKGITALISVIIVVMFLVSVLPRVANFLIGRYMKKQEGSIQGETPV